MRSLFNKSRTPNQPGHGDRESRHSSGWQYLQKHLSSSEGLRILDIGPTSAVNINFITNLGHSIYMANLVEEAAKPEWVIPGNGDDPAGFDVDRFFSANLNFTGRIFDVVILWDTADYLPAVLLPAVIQRIQD